MRGAGHREHKWLDSCRAQMVVAMADAKPIWYPPEFNFRSNPKNPSFDQKLELMDPDEDLDLLKLAAAEARFLACDINIIPCDNHWEEKYTFTPNEYIYAKIEIENVTQERVLLRVCLGRSFGRDGIQLEFVGVEPGYSRGGRRCCGIPIEPGEKYTVWRHFASANNPSIVCAYYTPQKPGKYSLHVKYYREYHSHTREIEIVADGN